VRAMNFYERLAVSLVKEKKKRNRNPCNKRHFFMADFSLWFRISY